MQLISQLVDTEHFISHMRQNNPSTSSSHFRSALETTASPFRKKFVPAERTHLLPRPLPAVAHHRLYPGNEFFLYKWFGQVIVDTDPQGFDFVSNPS
jgi:hypothetical protein